MLHVRHQVLVPYDFDVVLGQYWDWEHIRFVHPKSLGEYRFVEAQDRSAVYEQIWPKRIFGRPRSLVRQTQLGHREIEFEFLRGRYKGVRVHTRLERHPDGTLVDETYAMPHLPDWGWLRRWIGPWVRKSVDRVWQEDLDVKVCHGGWPGVPPFDAAAKPGNRRARRAFGPASRALD